jgi:hypothetical protein
VHFAEIDLAAAGAYSYKCPGMADNYIAANCFEFSAAANLSGMDVATAGAQRGITGNISYVDVAAGGEGIEIARDIHYLNVSALRFKLGGRTACGGAAYAARTDAPGSNVSALGDERCGAANVFGFDIPDIRVDFDVVSRWNRNFELHPELRAASAFAGLHRKSAVYIDSGGRGLRH